VGQGAANGQNACKETAGMGVAAAAAPPRPSYSPSVCALFVPQLAVVSADNTASNPSHCFPDVLLAVSSIELHTHFDRDSVTPGTGWLQAIALRQQECTSFDRSGMGCALCVLRPDLWTWWTVTGCLLKGHSSPPLPPSIYLWHAGVCNSAPAWHSYRSFD